MNDNQINLINKNILIYGLGKSGLSCFNFLKKDNFCILFDDNKKNIPEKFKKQLISFNKLLNLNFDFIVLSPGIDIKKCKISKYLSKNKSKIISDLDIFEISFPDTIKITVTGTNGKSTTSKLLYDVLKANKIDARLTGNIGYPILKETNVKKNTVFIIEASSYQLEYSKFFKSKYSVILNIHPDHLERHGTFKNYAEAKFKIIKSQNKNNFAFIEDNNLLNRLIIKNKIKAKVIKIDYSKYKNYLRQLVNIYFNNPSNKKNFCFALAIAKILKLNLKSVLCVANKFKGLDFRQQIMHKTKKLLIINDSKSTSFSSSISALKVNSNIFWLLGGLHKKNDKFNLSKKYFKNIQAFIYGRNVKFFNKELKGKIKYKNFLNLNHALKKIFMI